MSRLCVLLSALLPALLASPLHAQTTAGAGVQAYPTKFIRLIVPWPAGGDTDIVARLIGQKLSESLGRPVVMDNRPGASGSVGTEMLVRAPADGYTLLVSSMGTHTMNQWPYKLDFDPVEDVARCRCSSISRRPSWRIRRCRSTTSRVSSPPRRRVPASSTAGPAPTPFSYTSSRSSPRPASMSSMCVIAAPGPR